MASGQRRPQEATASAVEDGNGGDRGRAVQLSAADQHRRRAVRRRFGRAEFYEGFIERPGDIHSFWFEATGGETYQIDVEPVTLADSIAVLFDEYDAELAYNDDYGDSFASRIVWVAPVSGRYYVEIRTWGERRR